MPSGIPSREGEKVSKKLKIIDVESTGLRVYTRLDNKPRKKYGVFAKFLLVVNLVCEMAKNPHIFITRANQHTQEINRHFDGTLNHYGPMVFAENQEQNKSYTFKDALLQPDKSYFILTMIKEVESHKAISHWTLMKNSEVNNKHKNKDMKIKMGF